MILKIYDKTEINSKRLTDSIKLSGAVEEYEHIMHVDGKVIIYGKSILDNNALDTIFSEHVAFDLTEYKVEKMHAIDARTGELIDQGYVFLSKSFSLSTNAQTNILALYATKDNPALSYPIKFNTKDDAETINLTDAQLVEGMYLTALATKKAHLDSGTVLKDQIRAAATKENVDLVVDTR